MSHLYSLLLSILISFISYPCLAAELPAGSFKPEQFYEGIFSSGTPLQDIKKWHEQAKSSCDALRVSALQNLIKVGDTQAMLLWSQRLFEEAKNSKKPKHFYNKLTDAISWATLGVQKDMVDGDYIHVNTMNFLNELRDYSNNLVKNKSPMVKLKNFAAFRKIIEKIQNLQNIFKAQDIDDLVMIAQPNAVEKRAYQLCLSLIEEAPETVSQIHENLKKIVWFSHRLKAPKLREEIFSKIHQQLSKHIDSPFAIDSLLKLHKQIPSSYSYMAIGCLFEMNKCGHELREHQRLMEAIKNYKASKHPKALCNLANLYIRGISDGTKSQTQLFYEAESLFLTINTPESKYYLAKLLLSPFGEQRYSSEALRERQILKLLKDSPVPEACFLQGFLLEQKIKSGLCDQSYKDVETFYLNAKTPDALCALGKIYLERKSGLNLPDEIREKLGLAYLEKAHTSEAFYLLGRYFEDKPCDLESDKFINDRNAAEYYSKSSHPEALFFLGRMHEEFRTGQTINRRKSFQIAAGLYQASGTREAKYHLAQMLRSGRISMDLPINERLAKAESLYLEVQTPKSILALAEMIYSGQLYPQLSDQERCEKVLSLYNKVNNEEASFNMGCLYMNHLFVTGKTKEDHDRLALNIFNALTTPAKNYGIALLYLSSPLFDEWEELQRYKQALSCLEIGVGPYLSDKARILIQDLTGLIAEKEKEEETTSPAINIDTPVISEKTNHHPTPTETDTTKKSPKVDKKELKKQRKTLRDKSLTKKLRELDLSKNIISSLMVTSTSELPIIFKNNSERAFDTLDADPKTSKKLNILLNEINFYRNEPVGEGQPEYLKGDLKGYLSRRITGYHRLVYKVENNTIIIYQCGTHYGD